MAEVFVEKGPSINLKEGRSLYVWVEKKDFVFNTKMKTLPLKYYIPDLKKWEVPVGALSHLRKNFKNLVIKEGVEKTNKFSSISEYEAYLKTLSLPPGLNFEPKTKMDPHQLEWFLEMLERDKVILGDPMGLGKTKEYLDVCEYRIAHKGYKKILFLCKAKHKENMAKEVRIHCCKECEDYSLCPLCKKCPRYIVVDGPESKRIQLLRDFYYSPGVNYLIIGYEMAAHHSKHLKSLARTMGFDGVIMDEFNKIKNWGSNRKRKDNKPHLTIQVTKTIEVLNPELFIPGSGTPITKDPTDLYAVLRLVGAEERNHDQFKKHFCDTDHWGRIIGAKNTGELRDILASVMIRRPKALLKLPNKRVNYIPLRMTPGQRQLYTAAKNNIKEQLVGTKVYGAAQLALLTRLRQITTAPILVDRDVTGIKEEVLEDLLSDVIDGGEKAVVFSIYREYTKLLKEKWSSRYNLAYIDGTMNSKKAQQQVDLFETDPSKSIFLGSLTASNESYTMTSANHGIFIDMSWTVTDNLQGEDRIHRRGQTKPVTINYLYCEDSIDERVIEILKKDASLIYEVVEGAERTVPKELVEYLIS